MRHKLYKHVMLVASTCCVFHTVPGTVAAQDWRERFLGEGIARLAELEHLYSDLQGTIAVEAPKSPADAVEVHEFVFQGYCRLYKRSFDVERLTDPAAKLRFSNFPSQLVYGRNSRYLFKLKQGASESPYLVEYCGKESGQLFTEAERKFYRSIHAPFAICERPLREWVKVPDFKVMSVVPATIGGVAAARVKLVYATDKETSIASGAYPGFSGDLYLDPERYWSIQRADLVFHRRNQGIVTDGPYSIGIEYGKPIAETPVPQDVVHIWKYKEEPYEFQMRYVLSDLKRKKVGEHEFTLTAFGLPELMADAPLQPKSYLWLWLIGGGATVGLLAIGLRWRHRRTAA